MKILSVNKCYYLFGGAERYFFDLSKLLELKGEEVIPFSIKSKKNFPSPYRNYFMSSVDFFGKKGFFAYPGMALRAIYSSEAKTKIENILDRFKPEIAHLHMICHSISPSILPVLKKYCIPVVQTVHNFEVICPTGTMCANGKFCDYKCKGDRYYHALVQRCNRGLFWASLLCCVKMYIHKLTKIYEDNIDLFLTPSKLMKNKLIEFGIAPKKIRHIPYFVDIDTYIPRYNNSNYFLYFGRLDASKGIMTLIKAMRQVRGSSLYIAGEGALRPEIESLIQKLRLENVRLLGYISGLQLKDIISNAKFTVLPSEYYENYPLAILESFASGKPVIGSNIGGIPEIIEDERNGLLFELGNSYELSRKIQFLIDHPDICLQMGREARTKVEREYNPRLHYERIKEIYGELLSSKCI